MPVIKKTRGRSTRYYVVTRFEGRKQSHGGYATRREADAVLNKIRRDKDKRRYRPPNAESVSAYMAEWIERKALKGDHQPRTTAYCRSTVALYVEPVIGDMRLCDVQPKHIDQVLDAFRKSTRLGKGKDKTESKPATVARRYGMLRAAFADAAKSHRIAASPCDDHQHKPKVPVVNLNPPSPEEIERILAAATLPCYLPLALSAWTGLRRGEVLGLRWKDVNLDKAFLSVRQAATFTGREVTFYLPKSRRGQRTVPLTPQTVAMLREARVEQDRRRLAIGPGWRDLDLVVDNGDGSPMHPERLTHYAGKLMRNLGINAKLHDLRHSAATVMLAAGVSPAIVAEVMGHASMSFTHNRYGHLQPDHLRSAADAMASAYGG